MINYVENLDYYRCDFFSRVLEKSTDIKNNTRNYILMHKDIDVAEICISLVSCEILDIIDVYDVKHLPIGVITDNDGKVKLSSFNKWWLSRSKLHINGMRLNKILDFVNLDYVMDLVDKTCAMSLNDCYWLKPVNEKDYVYDDYEWSTKNFYDNEFSNDILKFLNGYTFDKDEYIDVRTPNIIDMDDNGVWVYRNGDVYKIKKSQCKTGQDISNELVANKFLDRLGGIEYVKYDLIDMNGEPAIESKVFVNPDVEFVSAHDIMKITDKPANRSIYQHYIECCKQLGYPIDKVKESINKMLILDYIMVNSFRLKYDFGILRNSNSLEFVSVTPIDNNGFSLWYNSSISQIKLTEDAMLSCTFRGNHIDQIGLVEDLNWLDLDKLDGIVDECREIFSSNEKLSDKRVNILCKVLEMQIENFKLV